MRYEPAGANLLYRNPVSSLDMFGSIALKNKPRRYGLFRRKRYDLNQANANLLMYSPFMKSDTVDVGDSVRWESEMLQEIAKKEKGEISETERRISQVGSGIGLAAAPMAAYGAVKAARNNEGGIPRVVIRASLKKLPKERAKAARKALRALDKPMSTKAKVAAGATGAGLVGLQLTNILGDAVTSRAMANAQRSDRGSD